MLDFLQALSQVVTPGTELSNIMLVTLRMALFSTAISMSIGTPLGVAIGFSHFRGKRLVLRLLNTLMGLPPVLASSINKVVRIGDPFVRFKLSKEVERQNIVAHAVDLGGVLGLVIGKKPR